MQEFHFLCTCRVTFTSSVVFAIIKLNILELIQMTLLTINYWGVDTLTVSIWLQPLSTGNPLYTLQISWSFHHNSYFDNSNKQSKNKKQTLVFHFSLEFKVKLGDSISHHVFWHICQTKSAFSGYIFMFYINPNLMSFNP